MTYALLDVMSGPNGPVVATRPWLANRLDCSVSGLAKALHTLGRPHGQGLLTIPPLAESTQRGNGLSAERIPIPDDPWVDVPEWSLGDDVNGPLVSGRAFRFYAILIHKRSPRRPWCSLTRDELADLLGVRDDSIPAILAELEAAHMVVVARRPGQKTLILPLTVQVDDADELARLPERMIAAARPQPVDKKIVPLNPDDGPDPSAGTAPRSSAGTAPRSSTGTDRERTDLRRADLKDPSASAPAPCGAAAPADADGSALVGEHVQRTFMDRQQLHEQVRATTARNAGRIAAARAIVADVAARARAAKTTSSGGLAALIAATSEHAHPHSHVGAAEPARLAA
jgi:hypothetical protein